MITNQKDLRRAFWLSLGYDGKPRKLYGKSQNQMPADTRMAFCDYVDALARDGVISEALAQRVTL
jgi:hypothetical protein